MRTRFKIIIIIGIVFFSTFTNESHAMCATEALEWWEACNDTGLSNALPLNPILMSILFVVGIFASIAGIVIWRKKNEN